MKKYLFSVMLLLSANFWCGKVLAQENYPFYNEIQDFKKLDQANPPPKNGILFMGSSSLRKWTDLEKTFADYHAINRGFGGSTLVDAIHYVNDLVDPYNPRQIIIYSGENDVATGNVSAEMVLDRFKTLFDLVRKKLPNVPIAFISMKPSPSRAQYQPIMIEANKQIQGFLQKQAKTAFIDIYPLMLDEKKQMQPELFGEDMLHMNAKGYQIWTKAIQPYLLKK